MRIEAIETFLAHNWLIVRIHTDNGIAGVGEGAFWSYPDATERIVQDFKTYLLGKDPLQREHHWQYLYRTFCFRGGAVSAALAAVDVALWDIAGKHYEAPIYELMGGKCRDKIRLFLIIGRGSVDELVIRAKQAVDEGYTAIKIDPIPSGVLDMSYARLMKEAVARVSAVREAVGPDVDIGVEIHRRLNVGEAITLGMELERFHLLFYEDPLPPESIQSWGEVAAKVRIPIATGERLYNIYEFRELLEAKGAHIVRPDVGVAGGLTQCKKIAAVAESFNAGFMAHNFLSSITTAACVQLDACIPNFIIQEYARDHLPPKSELLLKPLTPVAGYLHVPEGPGLGIDLNVEFLSKHPFVPLQPSPPVGRDGAVGYA